MMKQVINNEHKLVYVQKKKIKKTIVIEKDNVGIENEKLQWDQDKDDIGGL
jgi:hypothetical protein